MTALSPAGPLLPAERPDGDKTRSAGPPFVESVRRALRILRCFSLETAELGVSDIARQLGMHKSTVYRLLGTMEAEGFVHQIDTGRYVLGWRLFELGGAVKGWSSTRTVVTRHLASLVAATSETAHLAVFDEGSVLYIEKVESTRPLRMPSAVGKRVPAHCTALGKVFLANLAPQESLSAIRRPLARYTPKTIVDPDRLREELETVRVEGYAVDREEMEEGLMCLAAPICDDRGAVAAAISISGPSSRIEPRLAAHVESIRAASSALSAELGAAARALGDLGSPSHP